MYFYWLDDLACAACKDSVAFVIRFLSTRVAQPKQRCRCEREDRTKRDPYRRVRKPRKPVHTINQEPAGTAIQSGQVHERSRSFMARFLPTQIRRATSRQTSVFRVRSFVSTCRLWLSNTDGLSRWDSYLALLRSSRVIARSLPRKQNTKNNRCCDDQRGTDAAKIESARRNGFGQKVTQRRAERAGEDERRPE